LPLFGPPGSYLLRIRRGWREPRGGPRFLLPGPPGRRRRSEVARRQSGAGSERWLGDAGGIGGVGSPASRWLAGVVRCWARSFGGPDGRTRPRRVIRLLEL